MYIEIYKVQKGRWAQLDMSGHPGTFPMIWCLDIVRMSDSLKLLTGWWFQICVIFHFIYGMSSQPHWRTHIFSRWWNCTTNPCLFVGFQNPWLISIFQEMVSPRICSSGSPRSFWDAVGYHSSDPSAESLILPLPSYGVELIVFLI